MATNVNDENASSSWKSKRILIVSATLLALSTIFLAYSFTTTWSASTTITVYSPSLDLKVYWNSDCTDLVTSIDLGMVQKSTGKTTVMYIRNEGNGTVLSYWNSTLTSATSYISEYWRLRSGMYAYDLQGFTFHAGEVWKSEYIIDVDSECPSDQYDWILTLGADPL